MQAQIMSPPTQRGAPESPWKSYRLIDADNSPALENELNLRPQLSTEAELELIEVFFQSIQPQYPLFQKPKFLCHYATGQLQESLLSAVFAISAAHSVNIEVVALGPSSVSDSYALSAWHACSGIMVSGAPAGVDDLQALFLLALFEFRNSPNRRACSLAGNLVRLAFYYGLHLIDGSDCTFVDRNGTNAAEIEELRYLWWSIYTLDTICNVAVAAPSNTDLDMVYTSLPSGTIENWTKGELSPHGGDRIFLRKDFQQMSDTLRRISKNWAKTDKNFEVDVNFSIRIMITSRLGEACNLQQLARYASTTSISHKWRAQSDFLAALRLALPAGYLEPKRGLASAESRSDHTIRLENLLEMTHGNRIFSMPKSQDPIDSESWLHDWRTAMDITDDIVQIAKNWDTRTIHLADPAIGYIVFVSMVMIHTDSRLDHLGGRSVLSEECSKNSWQLLVLFLHQLSTYWLLPKALLAAAENFRSAASSAISIADASEILKLLQKPLTFRKQHRRVENRWASGSSNVTLDGDHNRQDISYMNSLNPNFLQGWFNCNELGNF
ncbi:uncharacterized protein PAC_06421 [Phialocephala subalpina]|uniref:Xylanolytic transcriptional activator regulatory domain-containing protein n=1 Tax=Phialocephala subalpina TaxID=576137 RepID=A0A1L7WUR8_9HELO|nr:uncharacterized protein PAC_06421 [Phialocephala subalpina]